MERQNVTFALKIFDEKNIIALKDFQFELGSQSLQTSLFIEIIYKWWLIVNVKHPRKGIHLRQKYAYPIKENEQESIKYLSSFVQWLQAWDDLPSTSPYTGKKCPGKLSSETQSALLHSTSAFIFLSNYLLKELDFSYVLLGKFQTDLLEDHFGKYRRMSGCNYNVSVQQILESERKLKVTHILKLQSHARGEISIKDFVVDFHEEEKETVCVVDNVEEIITKSLDIEVDQRTQAVLVFVAGYVGNGICNKEKCIHCASGLITRRNMEVDDFDQENIYIKSLDRGGLKYPTSFLIDLSISAYQVFQVIISQDFEADFLKLNNQRQFLYTTILEKFEINNTGSCICGKPFSKLYNKIALTWSNIFLNNYCKNINNTLPFTADSKSKRRKLATLNQSVM